MQTCTSAAVRPRSGAGVYRDESDRHASSHRQLSRRSLGSAAISRDTVAVAAGADAAGGRGRRRRRRRRRRFVGLHRRVSISRLVAVGQLAAGRQAAPPSSRRGLPRRRRAAVDKGRRRAAVDKWRRAAVDKGRRRRRFVAQRFVVVTSDGIFLTDNFRVLISNEALF